eukprot:3822505-Alexandrium_andersonii.AAC.1
MVEYAKTHDEIKGAFLTFPRAADSIYPGWKEEFGVAPLFKVQQAVLGLPVFFKKMGHSSANIRDGLTVEGI